MEPLPTANFVASAKRVFSTNGDAVFIGGENITEQLRSVLRDEAMYIQNSRLWEMFNDAIIQESANMALIQATQWDHVLSAKQLYHWGHVFRNMLHTLSK